MIPTWLKDSQQVFAGKRFDVHALDVPGRDGRPHRREVIVHPGAVVVLPLLDDQTVVMIRNYRVAAGQELWELPAGTLEPAPETVEGCARRELMEETGYEARCWGKLTEFFASPGILTEVMHVFLARELTPVGQRLEAGEQITVHALPLGQTLEMVRRGEIRDGKTVATLLYYQCFAGGPAAAEDGRP